MTAIEETADGGFRIGAAVPGAVLAEHPRFGKVWPGVLEAINLIGSKQVQGRASAGGNLCNGSPAGDSVPAMIAAGAVVTVQGPNGRRSMPVEAVPAGPGRTNLAPGEIVVSFTLPPRPAGSGDAYLRMIPRTEMDIAVVGVGVSLTMAGGVVHRRARGPGRRGADRAAGRGRREGADRLAARGCRAGSGRRRLPRRLQADQRQARHHRLSHQGRRRAAEAHGRHRRRSAPEGTETMSKLHVTTTINGEPVEFLCDPSALDAGCAARAARPDRHQGRLRHRRLRRLLHHRRWPPGLRLPDAGGGIRGPRDRHHRGHGPGRPPAPAAAEVPGNGGAAVRHLHAGRC